MGFFSDLWTPVRDAVESAAVLVGNYFVPGSSVLTSQLTSKGSQNFLRSDIGMIAQIGSSVYGATSDLSFGQKIGAAGDSFNSLTGTNYFAGTPASTGLIEQAGLSSASAPASLTDSTMSSALKPTPGTYAGSLTDGAIQAATTGDAAATFNPALAAQKTLDVGKVTGQGNISKVWDKISTFIGDNPGAAMMGLSAVTGGMGAVANAQTAAENMAYQKSLTDRAYANINSPVSLNIHSTPYQGLIGATR